MTVQGKKKGKSFEEELELLSEMTQQLSSGELSLEASIKTYEEGMQLIGKLQKELGDLEARLEMLDVKTGEIVPIEGKDNGNA